ncbi:ArsR/SmtB family transcription factor [Candidatus Acidulodesulfobacterium sp. H_13]|uniref:ArsR/SmtB family transcription factor n=1 Tax=Candidatus Acidulodesulfobacterium sp. H_13 TaxID=3395470 RepID=UPI003AF4F0DA
MGKKLCIGDDSLNRKCKELAYIFKLLSNPIRLGILCIVEGEEVSVNDISSALDKTQSNISQHLAVLRNTRMVDCKRVGNKLLYYLANSKMRHLIKDIKEIKDAEEFSDLKLFDDGFCESNNNADLVLSQNCK